MYDHLLCMTVNPGWGGQPYIETSTAKVARLRELLPDGMPIQVDGGIDADTAGPVAEAGATLFVAGPALFRKGGPAPPPPEGAGGPGAGEGGAAGDPAPAGHPP